MTKEESFNKSEVRMFQIYLVIPQLVLCQQACHLLLSHLREKRMRLLPAASVLLATAIVAAVAVASCELFLELSMT